MSDFFNTNVLQYQVFTIYPVATVKGIYTLAYRPRHGKGESDQRNK